MNTIDSIFVSLLTVFATAVLAWLGLWPKVKADLEKEYSLKFNDKKWEVYTEFAGLVRDMVDEQTFDPDDLHRRKVSLASQIILIGSDDVVSAFQAWHAMAELLEKGHSDTEDKLFDLIASMRKDLGNKYTRLSKEVLLGALNPNQRQN